MLCCLFNSFLDFLVSPSGIYTLIAISLTAYFTFIWESRCYRLLNKQFVGPPAWPLVGNALALKDPEKVLPKFLDWYAQFGNRFRVFFGNGINNLILVDPPDVEKILTSSVLIDKANTYDVLKPWLGEGLLISTGKKWHTRRKQLTPAFHFKILDDFLPIFNEHSKVLVEILKTKCANGDSIEMHEYVTRCALDIICETAMGTKLDCQRDLENVYAAATLKGSYYAWQRWTRPWLHFNWTFALSELGRLEKENRKILHDFTNQVIKERKEEFLKEKAKAESSSPAKNGKPDDEDNVYFTATKRKFAFLDLLLRIQDEDKEAGLTNQDIREETDTFMFEGHDTTSAGISWAIFLLGLHQDHQASVHEELDSIFGDDRERPITTTDLSKMKYLEYCIKESLRLYPSVPFFGRTLLADYQLDKDHIIPTGANVVLAPILSSRNPAVFPDPEEFRPSRFFPENAAGRHPYAFITFSAGPRNCIGQRFAYMEEKTVLATFFRSFKVDTISTPESVKPLPELIMRPKNGIHVKLTVR